MTLSANDALDVGVLHVGAMPASTTPYYSKVLSLSATNPLGVYLFAAPVGDTAQVDAQIQGPDGLWYPGALSASIADGTVYTATLYYRAKVRFKITPGSNAGTGTLLIWSA